MLSQLSRQLELKHLSITSYFIERARIVEHVSKQQEGNKKEKEHNAIKECFFSSLKMDVTSIVLI